MTDPDLWKNLSWRNRKTKEAGAELRDFGALAKKAEVDVRALESDFREEKFYQAKKNFVAALNEALFTGNTTKNRLKFPVYSGAGGKTPEDWKRICSRGWPLNTAKTGDSKRG